MILIFKMVFIILFLNSFAFGYRAFNGGVVAIEVKNGAFAQLFDKKIPSIKIGDKSYLLIPIPYKYKKRYMNVVVKTKKDVKTIKIQIDKRKYKKENIKVASSKVKPDKKSLSRIYKEYKEAIKIYNTITPKIYFRGKFIRPINSKITSSYGNARIFNKKLKSFHSGTDFRARQPTKVKAANDGVVVIAKDRYYAGGSVVIDHGCGIYSCYYHLSKILVKKGEKIKKSQIIALSGKSGRVNAPHLHFSVYLYGYAIDPLEFEKVVDRLVAKK